MRRSLANNDRNVLVIGDVHGCADELQELLSSVDLNDIDLVVFAGDLVDKGPDTVKTVKLARKLARVLPTVIVEGNHEERLRRFRRHLARGDMKAAYKIKDASFLHYVTDQLSDNDLAFLDSAVLYYPLPEHNAMVVHGGIPPKLDQLPPVQMSEVDKMPGRARKRAKMMQLVRYVTPEGSFVEKGREKKRDPYWADVYDGRFGTVLFGHQPFKEAAEPVSFPHAIGLDLGCVSGNALGGAILRTGKPAEFVARPAAREYYAPNKPSARAMPDLYSGRWLGYVLDGDSWVAVSDGSTPDEAIRRAT